MAVHVQLAVVVAIDHSRVSHPDLTSILGGHAVIDGHLPVGLAQLLERRAEAGMVLRRHTPFPEIGRLEEGFQREAEEGFHLRADVDGLRRRLEPDHVGHEREPFDDHERTACFERR